MLTNVAASEGAGVYATASTLTANPTFMAVMGSPNKKYAPTSVKKGCSSCTCPTRATPPSARPRYQKKNPMYIDTKPLNTPVGRASCGDVICGGAETADSCPVDCAEPVSEDDEPPADGGGCSAGGGAGLLLGLALFGTRRRRRR